MLLKETVGSNLFRQLKKQQILRTFKTYYKIIESIKKLTEIF